MAGATLITGFSYILGVVKILFNLPDAMALLAKFFGSIFQIFT